METKPIVIDIDDLHEFVGGAADAQVKDQVGHDNSTYPGVNSTVMCYYFGPSPDAVEDWIVIKGQ